MPTDPLPEGAFPPDDPQSAEELFKQQVKRALDLLRANFEELARGLRTVGPFEQVMSALREVRSGLEAFFTGQLSVLSVAHNPPPEENVREYGADFQEAMNALETFSITRGAPEDPDPLSQQVYTIARQYSGMRGALKTWLASLEESPTTADRQPGNQPQ
jgi:hypothetical protein